MASLVSVMFGLRRIPVLFCVSALSAVTIGFACASTALETPLTTEAIFCSDMGRRTREVAMLKERRASISAEGVRSPTARTLFQAVPQLTAVVEDCSVARSDQIAISVLSCNAAG